MSELRALVGARVSVVKGKQKVSHLAQHETGARWAAENNCFVVGSFEDLDISADKYDPWSRPDLGKWLNDEHSYDWDVIVWSKIDRAFRKVVDAVDFAKWARERKKIVVFAEDGLKLNYRNADNMSFEAMMAELFVYLGAFFGQLELNRFKSRALDGHRVLRQTDRWASGVPPLGFKTIPHPSGKGKGLDTDEYGKDLLYKMAGKLLEGWSFTTIAIWLNDEGYLTNMDRARIAAGKEPKKRPWTVDNVILALTSLKTQGIKMHRYKDENGKIVSYDPVLTPTGEMIQLAPPTFDDNTWAQIQAAAETRRIGRRTRTHTKNPMLGIGKCGKCGASLAQQVSRMKLASGETREYRSYRCGRTPLNCNGITMRGDDADLMLEETFLELKGSEKVKTRRFVPGEDHTHNLEKIKSSIARLQKESDAGLIDDEDLYFQRMTSLTTRRRELEKMPYRPAGWVTEELDHTYADTWATADKEQRRQMLIDAGVRFTLNGKDDFSINIPERTPEEEAEYRQRVEENKAEHGVVFES